MWWDVLSLAAAGVVVLAVLRLLDWYDKRRH